MVFNVAGASWDWAIYYGLTIGVEVLLLGYHPALRLDSGGPASWPRSTWAVMVFNAAGASWDCAIYYGLTIGVEVLLLAYHPALRLDLAPHNVAGDQADQP